MELLFLSHCLQRKHNVKQLRSTQRLLSLAILRAFKSTSTLGSLVLANWLPLDLQAIKLTACHSFKLPDDHPVVVRLFRNDKSFLFGSPILSLRNVPVNFPQKSYITTLEPWQSLPFYISIFPHKVPNLFPDRADECFIFTDGSLKNSISGCSVVVTISTGILKTNFFRLPDDTSIFEAETQAIIIALNFIKKVQSLYTNFTIHTDSKAVLASLSSRQKAGSTTNKVQSLSNLRRKRESTSFCVG